MNMARHSECMFAFFIITILVLAGPAAVFLGVDSRREGRQL